MKQHGLFDLSRHDYSIDIGFSKEANCFSNASQRHKSKTVTGVGQCFARHALHTESVDRMSGRSGGIRKLNWKLSSARQQTKPSRRNIDRAADAICRERKNIIWLVVNHVAKDQAASLVPDESEEFNWSSCSCMPLICFCSSLTVSRRSGSRFRAICSRACSAASLAGMPR